MPAIHSCQGPVDLTQLRYFLVVAESGSLTAAARQLGVSQPTLSVAVKNLEDTLSTTLFTRTRGGMRLTVTGDQLRSRAVAVLRALDEAVADIQVLEAGDGGTFTLGCHESLGAYFLPDFFAKLWHDHPNIEIQLWNGSSAIVRDAVLARDVHFGLVVNTTPHPDLVIVPIYRDVIQCFVPASLGPAGPRSEGARQRLAAAPLIYANRPVFAEIAAAIEATGVPVRPLVCGDLELVKSLTLSGIGVGVLPRRVAWYGQEGRLSVLQGLPEVHDTIHLVYRADLHRTRAALRLKEALVAHGRTLDAMERS